VVGALQLFPDRIAKQCADGNGAAIFLSDTAMASEGRLFWLSPLEWSVLLVGIALCGCFALLV
jgi:hypothetical protein